MRFAQHVDKPFWKRHMIGNRPLFDRPKRVRSGYCLVVIHFALRAAAEASRPDSDKQRGQANVMIVGPRRTLKSTKYPAFRGRVNADP
jgi:hypothetical protein